MNALSWQKAKNMRYHLRDHGYDINADNLSALLVQVANEEKITLEELLRRVAEWNGYEPSHNHERSLKELGF